MISSTSAFVYVYDMQTLKPAGRIKIGDNVQIETATTDAADTTQLADFDSSSRSRTRATIRQLAVGLACWSD